VSQPVGKYFFVGYTELRREVFHLLRQGASVALLGGRKCGGSAFLQSLQTDLLTSGIPGVTATANWLDIREICPRSPVELFRAIHNRVIEGTGAPAWETGSSSQGYQQFLARMKETEPFLREKYGPKWLAVLFVDPLDAAEKFLPDDEAFQNLRSLLSTSPYSRNFGMVAWGGAGMNGLIRTGSALNNLQPKYMRCLREKEVRDYLRTRHAGALPEGMESTALELSGGHPYLLFGLMRKFEESTLEPTAENLELCARGFMRDRRGIFLQWLEDFGETGRELFAALHKGGGALSFRELQRASRKPAAVEDALLTLGYHCVIDVTDLDRPRAAGSMFREWFDRNYADQTWQPVQPAAAPTTATGPGGRVFVVHGRNEKVRVAMFNFLQSLGLSPIEWHQAVEATENTAAHISDVLDSGFQMAGAAVVLLTPDDEARLNPKLVSPNDPAYEKDYTGQPRPNVLFEAGMAWARFPKKTIFVTVGAIRPFSDMSGVLMVPMDNTFKRRQELARRLKMAGCDVDTDSSTDWHSQGNFSIE
jgi:predicted nucleotide-binding protein